MSKKSKKPNPHKNGLPNIPTGGGVIYLPSTWDEQWLEWVRSMMSEAHLKADAQRHIDPSTSPFMQRNADAGRVLFEVHYRTTAEGHSDTFIPGGGLLGALDDDASKRCLDAALEAYETGRVVSLRLGTKAGAWHWWMRGGSNVKPEIVPQ